MTITGTIYNGRMLLFTELFLPAFPERDHIFLHQIFMQVITYTVARSASMSGLLASRIALL